MFKFIGLLHFNMARDAGSLVGLVIEAFRWIFGHGDGVLVRFGVVST